MFKDILDDVNEKIDQKTIMEKYLTTPTNVQIQKEKFNTFITEAKSKMSEIELKHQFKMYLIECLVSMICRGSNNGTFSLEVLLIQSILLDFQGVATTNEIQRKFPFIEHKKIVKCLEHIRTYHSLIYTVEIGSIEIKKSEENNNDEEDLDDKETSSNNTSNNSTPNNLPSSTKSTKSTKVIAWYIHYPTILHMCIQIAKELCDHFQTVPLNDMLLRTTCTTMNSNDSYYFCRKCQNWRKCGISSSSMAKIVGKCNTCLEVIDLSDTKKLSNLAISDYAKNIVRDRELFFFYHITKYLEINDNDYILMNEEDYDLDIRINEILSFEENRT